MGILNYLMEFPGFFQDSPKMCKKTMAMLYENADQICSEVKDNCVVQRFEFELEK